MEPTSNSIPTNAAENVAHGNLIAPTRATELSRSARHHRAEWTVSVAEGLLSVNDVLTSVGGSNEGRVLGAISLRQLLLASDEHGPQTRVNQLIERLKEISDSSDPSTRKITLAWLFDPRSQGKRLVAYCDAIHSNRQESPWPGFPFSENTAGEHLHE